MPQIRDRIAALQNCLRAADANEQDASADDASAEDANVKWVAPEHFHLTVKFVGDQSEDRLAAITEIGKTAAGTTENFRFRVCGASYFPKRGPLRTLWVGVTDGALEWANLARTVEKPLQNLGVPRDGGLKAHITLGRVKSPHNVATLRARLDENSGTELGEQAADRLLLMQSFLEPGGARYQSVAAWPFQQSKQTSSD